MQPKNSKPSIESTFVAQAPRKSEPAWPAASAGNVELCSRGLRKQDRSAQEMWNHMLATLMQVHGGSGRRLNPHNTLLRNSRSFVLIQCGPVLVLHLSMAQCRSPFYDLVIEKSRYKSVVA